MILVTMDLLCDCFTDYKEHDHETKDSLRAQENHQSAAHDIQVTGAQTTNSNGRKTRFEELN